MPDTPMPHDPDPAQLDPAQLDPAQLDPAQLDPAQLDPEQLDPQQFEPQQLLSQQISSGWVPTGNELVALVGPLEEAVLLLGEGPRIEYANASARQLAQRVAALQDERAGPNYLLTLLPPESLAMAREVGRWVGDLEAASGQIKLHTSIHMGAFSTDVGIVSYAFVMLRDTSQAHAREGELQRRHAELRQTYVRLAGAQEQLLQSEKMASIGQLAAGVAHEINNPIGYVHSNLGTLHDYVRSLFTLIDTYDRGMRQAEPGAAIVEIDEMRARMDLEFIARDLPQLLAESREGIDRVCKIVQDLKDFSYSGRNEPWRMADLHKGLDSTLNIVWNDLKYKAQLDKNYGELPLVECLPSEINQVFMNILLNAAHAIGERGTITLASGTQTGEAGATEVWIGISDTGEGIAEETLARIFDPFYTTKPVGRGTGLGLSISYGIVTKHHGRIEVASVVGEGTEFRIVLPVRQPAAEDLVSQH